MSQASELLGDFLRSRRERLKPDQVGLSTSRRRRTPGLRREEVASLAGISVEWYVKLEQGRAVSPSAATIDALADALRLSPAERAHLSRLAAAGHRPAFERETIPAALDRFIQGLKQPAYVVGLRWDVITWNDVAAELFGDVLDREEQPNLLRYMLTDPGARDLFGEKWSHEARRVVALFRPTHDVWAGDPAFTGLIAEITRKCPEFETWWKEHNIGLPQSGTKTLHHPVRGMLRYEYSTFQSNDDAKLKICVYNRL